jgi:hypothetical protein
MIYTSPLLSMRRSLNPESPMLAENILGFFKSNMAPEKVDEPVSFDAVSAEIRAFLMSVSPESIYTAKFAIS